MIFLPQREAPEQEIDADSFARARLRVLGEEYGGEGIGTLSEKALHRILKLYFEPDESRHEISFLGSVADIQNDGGIIEVQTRGLKRLIPKLEKFLPEAPVTVVYPLAYEKTLHWVDPSSGEISSGKKSPKHETLHDAVWELYNLREYLLRPNLTLFLCYLDVEEYKRRGGTTRGRRNRSTRIDRIPNKIEKILVFRKKEDYLAFLPKDLPETFTAKDLCTKISPRYRDSFSLLKILLEVGVLCECGKRKNSKLYSIH